MRRPESLPNRLLQWVALASFMGGCHGFSRDSKPQTPSAMCVSCCTQVRDACRLEAGHYVEAACAPRYRECATACESGDENEMCVVQTNRELASIAPKLAPVAHTLTTPQHIGECEHKGTWTLNVTPTKGDGRGCVALDSIPKQVSFRIGRRRQAYVLYDLAPVPGWSDAFSVENGADECIVTLQRENHTDADRPRSLALKLKEHDSEISGTLEYDEANRPEGCALAATIAGNVIAPPPPHAPPPQPMPPPQQLQPLRQGR